MTIIEKQSLVAIIKNRNCNNIPCGNCPLGGYNEKLDSAYCSAFGRLKNTSYSHSKAELDEIRYRKAVELFMLRYGKEGWMEEMI
jgi:hypothetical protein